tara:strand:- start:13290 stop:13652 length:363 start_codon:yes stop_codon:yes gene_type:complete
MKIIIKIVKSFIYSLDGLIFALQKEKSFRLELIIGLIIYFSVSYYIWPITAIEFLFMTLSFLLILITELINTSVEQALDRLHPEDHIGIKRSKDTASASVLISIIFALIVLVTLLIQHTI